MTEKKKEAKLVYFEQLALFFFKKKFLGIVQVFSDVRCYYRMEISYIAQI